MRQAPRIATILEQSDFRKEALILMTRRALALVLLVVLSPTANAGAQPVPAGRIVAGRVVDAQGAPIENAVVTVIAPNAPSRTTRTTAAGTFEVPGVSGGTVTLQVESPGFRTDTRSVGVDSKAPVEVSLQVAGVQEAINVTGVLPAGLTQMVETGTRLGLTLLETPASVQVLTGEFIRARGDVSVADAKARAVGVTSQADPGNGGGAVAARGFSGVGSVMQLFDGDQLFVGASTVTFPFDPWTVDRIEVVGGPASVLYGSGAIGGVVNVVPRKPSVARQQTMRLAGGSFDTWRTALDSTGRLGSRASYRADLSHNRSDGWLDRGDSRSVALSASARVELRPQLTLTISEDYGHQNPVKYFGTPSSGGRVDEAIRRTNYNVSDADIEYDDSWTQAKIQWQPSANARIRSGFQFLDTNRHWRNVENYSIDGASVLRETYIEIFHDQRQYGSRSDGMFVGTVAGRPNTLNVGFDYNFVRFEHVNNSPYDGSSTVTLRSPTPGLFLNLAGTLPKYRTGTHRVAGFVEDRLALTSALSLVGGARVDRYAVERRNLLNNGRAERALTPVSWRGGVVYAVRPSVSVYGQYSTATDMIGNVISNNPARLLFDPTTGQQVEVGVKQAFWESRGQWTVASYYIVKDGLVTPDPANSVTSVQIGQQSSRGIEATVGLALTNGVRLDANAAILRARYDDFAETIRGARVSRVGNRPPNIPHQTANLWLSWDLTTDWRVQGSARLVGRRYSDFANTGSVPGFAVVDAGVRRAIGSRIALDLRLWNLFDRIYATTYYDNGEPQWLLGDPRSAELAVTIRF